jgi:tetratricopeptide (TPR) repeat protein
VGECLSQAADKCIELKPDFAKGYSRKGTLQYFMKEYDKAIETYHKGLELDPESAELQDGLQRCVDAIGRCAGRDYRSYACLHVAAALLCAIQQHPDVAVLVTVRAKG